VTISLAGTFKSLMRNRVQALLTLSGMSVGVAMVVIVSGLGLGAHQKIEAQLQSAGPTLITIRSNNFTPAGAASTGEEDSSGGELGQGAVSISLNDTAQASIAAAVPPAQVKKVPKKTRYKSPATPLGDSDLTLLKNSIPDLHAVAASMEGNVSVTRDSGVPVNVVRAHGFELASPELQGWKLGAGRWISEREHAEGAAVMMLTSAAAKRLWPTIPSAMGQTLRFDRHDVRVVGTLMLPGHEVPAVVPPVFMPLMLARTLLKGESYDAITVKTASVEVTTQVAQNIRNAMRKLHRLPEDTFDDFRVETQSVAAMPSMGLDPRMTRSVHSNVSNLDMASYREMARSLRKAGRTFGLLLAGGAAVSLLVGGIGVMNIMLVSVTARTREIGLRMAVGARTSDVLMQFLAEAITLAFLGGLIGLILGTAGLVAVRYGLHWATALSPTMLCLALLMAAITGVVFGYGPARRAAVLDPVIALRSE
jgi:putative ABC transport system permease protein